MMWEEGITTVHDSCGAWLLLPSLGVWDICLEENA